MFQRRDQKNLSHKIRDFFLPRMGWSRALKYLSLRVKRIDDSPRKVARGLAAGIFVTFTPMFGLHFPFAMLVAYLVRGNILAALAATFFGNPLTFPIIAWVCYRLGAYMLGFAREETRWQYIRHETGEAFSSLWTNFKSIFGYEPTPWDRFLEFIQTIFVPYFVGGMIPGICFALATYFLSKPVIEAYQNRRKGRILQKFKELREAALRNAHKDDETGNE